MFLFLSLKMVAKKYYFLEGLFVVTTQNMFFVLDFYDETRMCLKCLLRFDKIFA